MGLNDNGQFQITKQGFNRGDHRLLCFMLPCLGKSRQLEQTIPAKPPKPEPELTIETIEIVEPPEVRPPKWRLQHRRLNQTNHLESVRRAT